MYGPEISDDTRTKLRGRKRQVKVISAAPRRKMAGLLRNCGIFARNAVRSQRMFDTVISKRLYSSELTLAVRKRIEDTRQEALDGGGQKRIDKQHAKVIVNRGLNLGGGGTCQVVDTFAVGRGYATGKLTLENKNPRPNLIRKATLSNTLSNIRDCESLILLLSLSL